MAGKEASLTFRLMLRAIQPPTNGKYLSGDICGEAAFEIRFHSQSMWLKCAEHKAQR
jgi:hypothetical protein